MNRYQLGTIKIGDIISGDLSEEHGTVFTAIFLRNNGDGTIEALSSGGLGKFIAATVRPAQQFAFGKTITMQAAIQQFCPYEEKPTDE